MKRHSGVPIDLQLIGKYLSGEASPEEAAAIDSWRTESAQNNRMFESTARLWEESAGGNRYRKPQNSANWLKLKESIDKAGAKRVSRLTPNKYLKTWKIAVAVLLF